MGIIYTLAFPNPEMHSFNSFIISKDVTFNSSHRIPRYHPNLFRHLEGSILQYSRKQLTQEQTVPTANLEFFFDNFTGPTRCIDSLVKNKCLLFLNDSFLYLKNNVHFFESLK